MRLIHGLLQILTVVFHEDCTVRQKGKTTSHVLEIHTEAVLYSVSRGDKTRLSKLFIRSCVANITLKERENDLNMADIIIVSQQWDFNIFT